MDVAASPVASSFAADDEVCLVTWRGCSCDLVGPSKRATQLAAVFQRSMVELVTRLGSLRVCVHRHREPSPLPVPGARFTLTVREFITRKDWFIEDVVMEITASDPPSPLGLS